MAKKKKGAQPAVVLTEQQKAARETARAEARAEQQRQALEKANALQLAQIVNLHLAGYSLSEIGLSIGATEREVDRLLTQNTARYIKNQPSLRAYVRNYISGQYLELLGPVMPKATDPSDPLFLESQDRALRTLDRLAKLHGAEAPVQKEVTIEAAPEAVEKLVAALADRSGLGYDESIFDGEFEEDVADAVEQQHAALEAASAEVERPSEGDDSL